MPKVCSPSPVPAGHTGSINPTHSCRDQQRSWLDAGKSCSSPGWGKKAKFRGFWGKKNEKEGLEFSSINSLNSFQLMAWSMLFCTTEINKELSI